MKESLRRYTKSLHEYQTMANEYGAHSTIVEVFYAQLDHHRTEYYLLRLDYEAKYGDVIEYKNSVHRICEWSISTGVNLLMKPVLFGWHPRHFR